MKNRDNATNSAIDYQAEIIRMMDNFVNKDLLKRVYNLLEYIYLHDDIDYVDGGAIK